MKLNRIFIAGSAAYPKLRGEKLSFSRELNKTATIISGHGGGGKVFFDKEKKITFMSKLLPKVT